ELFNFFVQLEFFGDNKYPSELKDIISRIIEEGMDKGFIRKMDKKIAYNFYVNATAGFMKDNREEILNCDNESKIPKLKMLLKRRAETLLHLIIHGLTGMK
ncbi:MAG: hypothetical protein SV062_14135, partial [Thermodesulfobacteriota bacterium]|nr:hypothetical protein [Thermodesulfobacteriota bacterium]